MFSLLCLQRRERRIKKKKKKIDVAYLFFFWVNWSYFTMNLLYYGLYFRGFKFDEKKFWAFFKKWALSLKNIYIKKK
jgi:hypothetical protein